MENLRKLELEFSVFENKALAQVLSLSTSSSGLQALSLKGNVSLGNLKMLSKMSPSPLQSVTRLEIQEDDLFIDPSELVSSLTRLLPSKNSLKELEISFDSFELLGVEKRVILESTIRRALPDLAHFTIRIPTHAKELTDEAIEGVGKDEKSPKT